MKNKKKKLIAILLALTCLFVVVVGAYAAFDYQYSHRTRNIITTGKIDIEVNEYADAEGTPFPEAGVTGVMPGVSVTKIVEIENTGDSPAWVRVKVDKLIRLAEGVAGTPDPDLVSILDINTEYWTLHDGWYYYNTQLAAGAKTTAPLFTTVKFAESMENMYQNSTAEVKVSAQAVQTKNNVPDSGLAYDALGWPAEGGD